MFEILLSPPDVGQAEIDAVVAAMRSGWVAPAGPDLVAFESEIAARVGVPHAVAVSSGTAALHLALVSWGVGPGDVVPVSTLTFAATINAIRYVGAVPHLIDSDAETGNMNPHLLREALHEIRSAGASAPVVIPVDLLGKSVDHAGIAAAASEFGALVLSDAAESLGATRDGRPAGSFGAAAVASFNGNKIMTTSGGGMLLTHDDRLAAHARKLSTQAREPVAHYEHTEIGYNYRLSNLLAALGRAQLGRLDEMISRRREWRRRYHALFSEQPGMRILGGADDTEDNCWLTAVIVEPATAGKDARVLSGVLGEAGIESRPLWKPMHQQPVHAGVDSTLDGTSDRLFAHGLTLPGGSGMTQEQFARVERAIRHWLLGD